MKIYELWPNKSPEPTAVGACSSAVAVHVTSRRWLSFFVRRIDWRFTTIPRMFSQASQCDTRAASMTDGTF